MAGHTHKTEAGFSLIEAGMIITIGGLLLAGSIAAMNMRQSAVVKALVSEQMNLQSVITAFKDKYDDLPGDLRNAEKYWDVSQCGGSVSACNGDGDEHIEWDGADAAENEGTRAWQHLELSGLGGFGGLSGTGTDSEIGVNAPQSSAMENGGWYLNYDGNAGGMGNYLGLGVNNAAGGVNDEALMVPKNAFSLDNKLDDGDPDTGNVRAANGTSTTCISSGIYDMDSETPACTMTFKLQAGL